MNCYCEWWWHPTYNTEIGNRDVDTLSSIPTQHHHYIVSRKNCTHVYIYNIYIYIYTTITITTTNKFGIPWNEYVVIILVGKMSTDMITYSKSMFTQSNTHSIIIVSVSSNVQSQSYITINTSRRTRRREAKSTIGCCGVLIFRP